MSKRNQRKMELYKKVMKFCSYPQCQEFVFVTHHIIPVINGGGETFDNYIALCKEHHRKKGHHSNWEKHQVELYTWKFFAELNRLGFTSDIPEKEFYQKVAEYKASQQI